MAKRRKKVHSKTRKAAKRKVETKRRKVVTRKARKRKSSLANSAAFNHKAQWKAYKELQMRADKAWEKFRSDVKKNARSDILIRDHNHLRLLLGECNYMARECMRIASKRKQRR